MQRGHVSLDGPDLGQVSWVVLDHTGLKASLLPVDRFASSHCCMRATRHTSRKTISRRSLGTGDRRTIGQQSTTNLPVQLLPVVVGKIVRELVRLVDLGG